MDIKKNHSSPVERTTDIVSVPPAAESFSDLSAAARAWPKAIVEDKDFRQQIEFHGKLIRALDMVTSRLPRPDITLQDAIEQSLVGEQQVIELYASLTELLENNDYRRLIFYMPFEFLSAASWQPSSDELGNAAGRFRNTYMKQWRDLLHTHDVRANFVDGDVPEVELRTGDLPRVAKAAHLLPQLTRLGLIQKEEFFELLKDDDEVLRHSVADTLPVLAECGYLSSKDCAQVLDSDDSYVKERAFLAATPPPINEEVSPPLPLQDIFLQLDRKLEHIATETHAPTEKRTAWLLGDRRQKGISEAGDAIKSSIIAGENLGIAKVQLENAAQRLALVDGIRKAIIAAAVMDMHGARKLYADLEKTLRSLQTEAEPEASEIFATAYRHFYALGIIDKKTFQEKDIPTPSLAGPFSENLKTMNAELAEIKRCVGIFESEPEIARFVYPVILIFGSRLKGYGAQDADSDIAVFVRPETAPADAETLRSRLAAVILDEKFHGEVVEFWLERFDGTLRVRDGISGAHVGRSSWTHILFGAAWEGDEGAIHELFGELLTPYFQDTEQEIDGAPARARFLEELERDTLQYRLMHKGYAKFFPPVGGIRTAHADQIDSQSTFWDSGYRQTATRLFVQRVFLPKLHK